MLIKWVWLLSLFLLIGSERSSETSCSILCFSIVLFLALHRSGASAVGLGVYSHIGAFRSVSLKTLALY